MYKNKFILLIIFTFLIPKVSEAVIYGQDDMIELKDAGTIWYSFRSSLASLIYYKKLISIGNNEYKLKESFLNDEGKYCNEVRFKQQIDRGLGTGWLISERHLITAGHLSQFPDLCKNGLWLFDYFIPRGANTFSNIIKASSVYRCKKIVDYKAYRDEDFMIIELDRKVSNRLPLKLSNKSLNGYKNLNLAMLSFSNGLPLKLSNNGIVLSVDEKTFYTNLENSGGASGSPIFDTKTLEVVGMQSSGYENYYRDPKRNCKADVVCNFDGLNCSGGYTPLHSRGERAMPSRMILNKFKKTQLLYL